MLKKNTAECLGRNAVLISMLRSCSPYFTRILPDHHKTHKEHLPALRARMCQLLQNELAKPYWCQSWEQIGTRISQHEINE